MDGPHQLGKVQSSSSSTGRPWPGPAVLVVFFLPEQAGQGVAVVQRTIVGSHCCQQRCYMFVWWGEVTLLWEGSVQAVLDELSKERLAVAGKYCFATCGVVLTPFCNQGMLRELSAQTRHS